jgi:thiamine monophosphate kinase
VLLADAARLGVAMTRIGAFRDGPAHVAVLDANGETLTLVKQGWSHF